ncbi:MAG: DUF349 domain-containing protein [Bacteroidales bacterium]|nr:DUF349 domain-containing protein [Candidatus Colimorpha merdihippi]MCQ2282867.1 DUF349 domain-containing protein [Bacteroidales bacterium]
MEELNEMQPNVQNDELQTNAQQSAADIDSNTNNVTPAPEPVAETMPEAPATETPAEAEPEPEVDYSAMTREELLAALNELMQQDVARIRNRVSAIRNQFNTLNKEVEKQAFEAFLADGGNKDDYKGENDELANTFYKVYETYRNRRQKMLDEIEAAKQRNLEAKRQLLEQLRLLIDKDEETLKQTYDEFNVIQEKWKSIGDVPREQMNDLWQNYHFLIEQFFNKIKINKELRMLDLKRNLEQKIQLCEKAEELIVETSVVKAFKALQELRAQWKEIGPVPQEQNEETWQRFNNAANQIDSRRREYYDQRNEEFDQNLLAKQALIEKANELTQEMPTSTKQWNDVSEELDKLLSLWRSIGPVPREQNESIWKQFKGTIDKHYADKKQHFGQMRDEQTENYNKKVNLCLRAEAIAKREDWKKATEELLQLQAEWKTIGATSRKVSDKIWHRFRSACDEFFDKKGEFFKDIRSSESENLEKKAAIIEEMKAFVLGEDKDANLSAIKEFQRRWSEIGHVPMKEKDRIMTEYRGLLDGFFEKLKITAREMDMNRFRERVRSHAAEGKKFANSERDDLMSKIEKLRADLKLWENNLGFLASSKQADLLKQEFEKKMQAARQQIALLEAKLRILDEPESTSDNTENN